MKKNTIALIFGLFFSMGMTIYSFSYNHIGGDIGWKCLGNDTFLMKVTVFRDCNSSSMSSITLNFKCASTGTQITTLNLSKPAPVDITPRCGSSCTRCQSSGCSFPYGIEKYEYTGKVYLGNAGSCCEIKVEYDGLLRSYTISTGPAGSNFFITAMFNRCLSPCDNSPIVSNDPLFLMCIGQDQVFSSGFTDHDKDSNGRSLDSLAFEWTTPLINANNPVSYSSNYSYDHPIFYWGFKNANLPFPRGFHLNGATGEISFRPMKIEQTLTGLKVSEFRKINGVQTKIGEITQELHFITMSCPNNNAPVLSSTYVYEVDAGDTAICSIQTNDYDSNDSLTISWSNNLPGAIWTDNNGQVKHPTGVLKLITDSSMIGKYYYFMVGVKDNACPVSGSSTRAFYFLVKPPCKLATKSILYKDLGCGNYMFYPDTSTPGQHCLWTGSAPDAFTFTTDTIYRTYRKPGIYYFTLKVSDTICSRSIPFNFGFNDTFITVNLPPDTFINSGVVNVFPKISHAKGNYRFKWHDGDSVNLNRSFQMGVNTVLPIAISVTDSAGCSASDAMTIYKNTLTVDLGSDQYRCDGTSLSLSYKTTIFGNATYVATTWYKAGNAIPLGFNTSLTTSDTGQIVVKVEYSGGIIAYDTIFISIYEMPKVDAGRDTLLCSGGGLFELTGSPTSPASYWSGTATSKINDKYYFDPHYSSICNGCSYSIYYYHVDSNGCKKSDYKRITVKYSAMKPEIGTYGPFCKNDLPVKLNANLGPGQWSGKGMVGDYFYPANAGSGLHEIVYTVGPEPCTNSDTAFILVYNSPEVSLSAPGHKTSFCTGYGLVPLTVSPAGGILSGPLHYGPNFNADTTEGTYIFSYRYQDNFGCVLSDSLSLSTGTPVVSIVRDDSNFCEGEHIILQSQNKNIPKILWSAFKDADGHFLNQTDFPEMEYLYGNKDLNRKYVIFYLNGDDSICKPKTDSILVHIGLKPEVSFRSDPPVYHQNNHFTVQFYDQSKIYNPPATYLWDLGNSLTSKLKDPLADYYAIGNYDISLEVTDACNCVSKLVYYNYLYLNELEDILNKNQLLIYPNPTDDEIQIHSPNIISSLRLLNSLGQAIFYQQDIHAKYVVLPSFPKGLYLLELSYENGTSTSQKVIYH